MAKDVLILIDVQQEYNTEGRPFYLNGIEPSLDNCCRMLQLARDNNWEVAHVQHSNGNNAPRFNPTTPYFNFIKGFEPLSHELLFVKKDFSCYSNVDFSAYMDNITQLNAQRIIYVVGYNSVMCCLSTLEGARIKDHQLTFIEDASYAKAMAPYNEEETHSFMMNIYQTKKLAAVVKTQDVVQQTPSTALPPD